MSGEGEITEFGRCGCGAWAVVKLNGTPSCLVCLNAGLTSARLRLERAWRDVFAPASPSREARP